MASRILVVAVLLAGLLAGAAVPTLADHGGRSDYTVIPHDRQPGAESATYEQHAISPIDFEYLDYIRATWTEGDFSDCGPSNSERFGIDRGNDASGTKTDEGLTQYVEETKITEDVFLADFYEREDAIGTSTYLNEGDEFVSLTTNCFGNPDDAGWYQIQSTIGGTLANGTYVEASDVSHYFYICDCASRQEARRKLGPPPSAESSGSGTTATSTPAPTRTPRADGTPYPSPSPTATAARSEGTRADVATTESSGHTGETGGGGGTAQRDGGAAADAGTPTGTVESWERIARTTPTVGSGAGFGPLLALVALLAAAALACRR